MKTLCLASGNGNQLQGRENCQNLGGMLLFAILTQEDLDVAVSFTQELLVPLPAGSKRAFWIDGQLKNGKWIVNNPTEKAMFSGAVPNVGPSSATTLVISNDYGPVQTARRPSNNLLWPYCEYDARKL